MMEQVYCNNYPHCKEMVINFTVTEFCEQCDAYLEAIGEDNERELKKILKKMNMSEEEYHEWYSEQHIKYMESLDDWDRSKWSIFTLYYEKSTLQYEKNTLYYVPKFVMRFKKSTLHYEKNTIHYEKQSKKWRNKRYNQKRKVYIWPN